MAFRVVKRGTSAPSEWRLFEVKDTGKRRIYRQVPPAEYHRHGFSTSMTIEQARERARELGKELLDLYHQRRREKIKERVKNEEQEADGGFLPKVLCRRFEVEVLKDQICWGEENKHYKQLLVYWRAAKRVIQELPQEPSDWGSVRNTIYGYFMKNRYSLSYAQKVMRLMNLWGKFYSKEQRIYFEAIEPPTGAAASKIREAFFGKRPTGLLSAPITWSELQAARGKIDAKQWNWLFLSLWFGLRPSELDNLKWKVVIYKDKTLLAVYQQKLYRLPPDERWKFIPVLFDQQREGLEIIKAGDFKRPSVRVIRAHVNPQASCRAGRKGFVALMWEMGKLPKQITFRWLGHKSVKTTDSHYVQAMQQAAEF